MFVHWLVFYSGEWLIKILICQSADSKWLVEYLALKKTSRVTQSFREHWKRGSRNKMNQKMEKNAVFWTQPVTELVNTQFISSCGYLYRT